MEMQFFILGRNPILSAEEILAFAKARDFNGKKMILDGNILLLETNKLIDIQKLGGTIKAGKIIFSGSIEEFISFIEKNEMVQEDKFSYAILGNVDQEILKEKFKLERKKAILKHGRKKLRMQEGEFQGIPNADYEILIYKIKQKVYVGIVDQEFDYEGVKKRDMNKPVRREELAISPRLSRILVNLSGVKEDQDLLDPFCGIGSVLLEALVLGINVYGIDKDQDAINGCRKNLDWLRKNFPLKNKYTAKSQDSAFAPDFQFDGVATETPLGELQNKKPSRQDAEKMISDFSSKILPVLTRIKKVKKPSAKIAITFPVVNEKSVDVEEIAKRCGLKILLGPLKEFREKQYVSREIIVFQ